MTPLEAPLVRILLTPPAALYRGLVGLRNRLFDSGTLRSERLPVPVISVGNLTVGGTGKTPLVAAIAAHLTGRGLRVAILSRGYGGSPPGGSLVLGPGARRGGALAGADGPESRADVWAPPEIAGDEPLLLSRQLPDVSVIVGANRRETGRLAHRRHGAQVILLDDGFQHRWLQRDLDIVVLDVCDPFGQYRLLPAGRLREPVSSLRRADLIVVTRSHPEDRLLTLTEVVRRHNPDAPIHRAYHRPLGFVPLEGGEEAPVSAFAGRVAAAFCGIGNPEAFRTDLAALGIHLTLFRAFRDHHAYTRAEIADLMREARVARADCLITTEKDAVRLGGKLPAPPELPAFYLRIRCDVADAPAFFETVERAARLPVREGIA